jgi:hypothetical protein
MVFPVQILRLTFANLAVTLHTTRFNIQKVYVVPTLRLCVLCESQNKATFALLSIKRLVFITEVDSVYSAVRTGSLYKTDKFRL